jgi:hypothetical protein
MKITQEVVRVYGIKEHYEKAFLDLFNSYLNDKPLAIKDFPRKSENFFICIGKYPQSIFEANRISIATHNAMVSNLKKIHKILDHDLNLETLIENELDKPYEKNYNYYITLIVKKEGILSDKDITDNKYFWLNLDNMLLDKFKFKKEFTAYASNYIDLIATYLSTITESVFFGNVLIKDELFISTPNRRKISLFELNQNGGTATGFTTNPLESGDLEIYLDKIRSKKHHWLNPIAHYWLATIKEKDIWKRFYWSFVTLELLIESTNDKLYDEMVKNINFKNKEGDHLNIFSIQFAEILKPKNELSLKEKFTIMTLEFFPNDLEENIKIFSDIKKVRDSLSHGNSPKKDVNEENLPIRSINYLLQKYLTAILNFYLDNNVKF